MSLSGGNAWEKKSGEAAWILEFGWGGSEAEELGVGVYIASRPSALLKRTKLPFHPLPLFSFQI